MCKPNWCLIGTTCVCNGVCPCAEIKPVGEARKWWVNDGCWLLQSPSKDQLLTMTLRTLVGPEGVAVHEGKQMTQQNLSSLDFAPLQRGTWSK